MAPRVGSRAWYEGRSARSRAAWNKFLDVVEAKEEHPKPGATKIARTHHLNPGYLSQGPGRTAFRKVGGRLELRSPGERRLYRGPISMLANVDGQPQIVRVVPANDHQYNLIKAHDREVWAAVTETRQPNLAPFERPIVGDLETGERYHFVADADAVRDAADTGGFELRDLQYQGRGRHDLDRFFEEEDDGLEGFE